jgi:Flp pilus assembly protein TadG
VGSLLRQCGGTVAVEFAVALPVLILMFMGIVELSQGLIVYMKVVDAATTASDLVSQQMQVSKSDLDNYYLASQLVMTPSPPSGLKLAVSSIKFDPATGNPSIDWSVTRGGAAAVTDAAAATGLGSKGDSVIAAEATYVYNSFLKYLLPTGVTITARVYSRPRVVFSIPCTAPCT